MTRFLAALPLLALVACGSAANDSADAGAGTASDASTTTTSSTGATFPDPDGPNGTRAQLFTDDSGTSHVLYTGLTGTDDAVAPVRYGQCKAACHRASSWRFVTLGEAGLFGGSARLAVSPAGAAHVVWTYGESLSSGTTLRYAACASGCADSASWHARDIASDSSALALESPPGRPIALDSTGLAHLVFNNATSGLAYAFCSSDCATTGAWTFIQLTSAAATAAALVVQSGKTYLLYASSENDALVYRTCAADCSADPSAWTPDEPLLAGVPPIDLRLTKSSHPRIVYNQGSAATEADYKPIYAICDGASCLDAGAWSAVILGEAFDGNEGLSLALRPDDRPIIAYNRSSGSALAVAACQTACDDLATATWSEANADSPEQLQILTPAVLPACSGSLQPKAFWYPADHVSLVATATQVSAVYDAYILQQCGMGTVSEALRLIRFNTWPLP